MGIDGLLQFIKPCFEQRNLFSFSGQKAAIDAMSFIYKGCYGYAYELNNGIETNEYMLYLLNIIRLIRGNGIECVAVFDGRSLRAKALTAIKRAETKHANLQLAKDFQKAGNTQEAHKYFQRCLRVTKSMIYEAAKVLKASGVQIIISPYEADSQLSFLVRSGQVDFAVSEDSDLVCFGCPRVAFKIKLNSTCEYLDTSKWTNSLEKRKELKNESLRVFWGQSELHRIYICVLSGCDYFPGAPGIGLKKASDLFGRFNDLETVINMIKSNSKVELPKNYEETVSKIAQIFRHQRVYDPQSEKVIMINPLDNNEAVEIEENNSKLSSIDEQMIGEIIHNFKPISEGNVHIDTGEIIPNEKIDMKKYFGSKKRWTGVGQVIQIKNDGIAAEKKSYKDFQLDQKQMEELRDLQRIKDEKNNERKNNEIDEIGDLLDSYNQAYPDNEEEENKESKDNDINNHDIDLGLEDENVKGVSDEIRKKREEENARYLSSLCDTFLRDYAQLNKDTETNVQMKQYPQNNLEEDNQNDQANNKIKTNIINPFANSNKKSKTENNINNNTLSKDLDLKNTAENVLKVTQPDSLECLGVKRVDLLPGKKKAVVEPLLEAQPNKKKVIITDFFKIKKKK